VGTLCRPLPYHLGTAPKGGAAEKNLERETGFEPATSTLARSHSTTELLPLSTCTFYNTCLLTTNHAAGVVGHRGNGT
jgi:hypothetical protein